MLNDASFTLLMLVFALVLLLLVSHLLHEVTAARQHFDEQLRQQRWARQQRRSD